MNLVFVCTGNICRSPTAERLAAAWAADNGVDELTATSAGTRAMIGSPMEPLAAKVLSSLGGTPDGFAGRQLTPVIAGKADLILTMTQKHRDKVLRMAPRQLRRTFTLLEAAHLVTTGGARSVAELDAARATAGDLPEAGIDIRDPIGRDVVVFEQVGEQIADALVSVLDGLYRA
ncbi:arsenate reductase/protein-tyrosine-phosphatase family protein [Rhodococcus sp. SGAir0479]|uniref:arsenate reductase/protein-tyrosine-phosphatase family protein n=1 Tax=Rhodococcus sp. SGAir0479 TaxID=2567884 RepID=UPI0010CCFC85|nr:low molecular weight phosphatase family protein [Rhodococcus sp. SGAir0479]QCQ92550.1 low molecular weight phosphatase family protein [Rhodococcus sp. SGAir0479]